MDLRTGRPWWLEVNPQGRRFSPLTADVRCDVAVVGAGVTGALTALALAERGVHTVVLDRREAVTGSTAASTALLMAETDAELAELARRRGLSQAVRAWRLGERAIDDLETLDRRLACDTGFERLDTYYLASDRRAERRLAVEERLRRSVGFQVERLGAADLRQVSSFPNPGALRGRGAVVDPIRLTRAALDAAVRCGASVHELTPVAAIEDGAADCRLRSTLGPTVHARRVVVAAGYEAAEVLGLRLGRLRSTYVFASDALSGPVDGWPDRALVWETARPYLYARWIGTGRLMVGGGDTAFAGDHRARHRAAARIRRLARRLARLVPDLDVGIAAAWAGTFGESDDALPCIGVVPGRPRLRAALGFGGNGITFAAIASRLLAAELAGERDPDLDLFALDR